MEVKEVDEWPGRTGGSGPGKWQRILMRLDGKPMAITPDGNIHDSRMAILRASRRIGVPIETAIIGDTIYIRRKP